MTKDLPRVTQITGLLNKPDLVPWSAGLAVESMQKKTVEIVDESINKILKEIKDMDLVKIEAMKEKLKIARDEINKNFLDDNSEIAKEAKSRHEKVRDEAADRGTRGHVAIERFLKLEDDAQIKVDKDISKPFGKFIDWWAFNDIEVLETECSVWSEEGGGYKGKFDLAANIRKKDKTILYLIDYKFTPRLYADVKMQLAAYFYGWKQRTNYIPERAAALRLDFTDGPEEFKEILESDLYVQYKIFLKFVEAWHLIND